MGKIITMEDGLQQMKQAFPEDASLLQEKPSLGTVYTGCHKTIRFCLIVYAKGFYYVKELISGHSYKTTRIECSEMPVGTHYDNLTVIEDEHQQLAVQID